MAAVTKALPARPLAGTDEALLVAQIEFTEWESYRGHTFYFMTFRIHRAAASFSRHSACFCTVVLISNLLSK